MLWDLVAVTVLLVCFLVLSGTLVATSALTLDTGWGRRLRPLGPLLVRIDAPREVVFDVAAAPYLSASPPRALSRKGDVGADRGVQLAPDQILRGGAHAASGPPRRLSPNADRGGRLHGRLGLPTERILSG